MTQHRSPDTERIDELYRLLATRHRRATLRYFRDASSDVASLGDIAEGISDHGGEEQARLRLHHDALPRLAEAGVLEYDRRSHTVRYHGHPDLNSVVMNAAYI